MEASSIGQKGFCHNKACEEYGKKYCSACKYAYYCSLECQRKDWPSHKRLCDKSKFSLTEKRDIKFINKLDASIIRDMVVADFCGKKYSGNDYQAAYVIIHSDILDDGKDISLEKLWRKTTTRFMPRKEMAPFVRSWEGKTFIRREREYDMENPLLFFLVITYKQFNILSSFRMTYLDEAYAKLEEWKNEK